jgi:dynactin complex subunit
MTVSETRTRLCAFVQYISSLVEHGYAEVVSTDDIAVPPASLKGAVEDISEMLKENAKLRSEVERLKEKKRDTLHPWSDDCIADIRDLEEKHNVVVVSVEHHNIAMNDNTTLREKVERLNAELTEMCEAVEWAGTEAATFRKFTDGSGDVSLCDVEYEGNTVTDALLAAHEEANPTQPSSS